MTSFTISTATSTQQTLQPLEIGVVTASGVLAVSTDNAVDMTGGILLVQGAILSTYSGVSFTDQAALVDVAEGGRISATGFGIYGLSTMGTSRILNQGTISGSTRGIVYDGSVLEVENHGLVSGGISLVNPSVDFGLYTILNTGTLTEGIEIQGGGNGSVILNNSGLIEASRYSGAAIGSQGAADTILNTGRILGGVFLGSGNDTFDGSLGQQSWVSGDQGDDVITGGGANETLNGGDGADWLRGMAGDDDLYGGLGDNRIWGGLGDDDIDGGSNNDTLQGGAGDDLIYDLGGARTQVNAGEGNDQVLTGSGTDTLQGGTGDDTLSAGDGVDRIEGGAGNDALYGGNGVDSFYGGSGDDIAYGGTGNDFMLGEDGNDALLGEGGTDEILGGGGDDQLSGADGNDALTGQNGDDALSGGLGDDRITAGRGDDTVFADDGNDSILAGSGDDSIMGGAGNDTIEDGAGNDTILGEAGSDLFIFRRGPGIDVVNGFQNGFDRLDLHSYGFANFAQLLTVTTEANGMLTFDLTGRGGDYLSVGGLVLAAFDATDVVL